MPKTVHELLVKAGWGDAMRDANEVILAQKEKASKRLLKELLEDIAASIAKRKGCHKIR